MTLWISVPQEQRHQATRALIDAEVTVHGTRTGPHPHTEQPPRRDVGEAFLLVSFGLSFLGLGGWGLWEGGWWILPAVLSVMAGLICISASLSRPKIREPRTSGDHSEPV